MPVTSLSGLGAMTTWWPGESPVHHSMWASRCPRCVEENLSGGPRTSEGALWVRSDPGGHVERPDGRLNAIQQIVRDAIFAW